MSMKRSHTRNISGELDVFEAARYFSGYNDNHAPIVDKKVVIKEQRHEGHLREGRASLDIPSMKNNQQSYHNQQHDNHQCSSQASEQQKRPQMKEEKKYKQPSSPGGKLAHFLNSLLNSKKKKKISTKSCPSTQYVQDHDDESPNGRRKRRFSISHFRSTTTNSVVVDSKSSIYSSSSYGFRTPPPYTLTTPTKSNYNNIRSFGDYKDVLATLSKHKIQENGHVNVKSHEKVSKGPNLDWMDEKIKVKNGGFGEETKSINNVINHGCQEKIKSETKKLRNEEVGDGDGVGSDSSSDLFELQIDYEFGFCSSGLPVYETTHMDSIKRSSSTAITNGPIKL